MRTIRLAAVLLQVAISVIAATYAVNAGIPYLGFGPLPWWKTALRWPWSVAIRFSGTMHPLAIMLVLFAVYSAVVFLILQYLIVKTAFKPRTT
jgi:hypothetical protein